MTQDRRFERTLGELLTDLAMPIVPAYRDDIVRTVAGQGQRPAWTFPERWLPMDVVTQRGAIAPIRWRPIAVFLLIALLMLAGLVLGIGSRHRLPAPYGPAANGVIAYHLDGDIYLGDPVTGESRPIVTGPEIDAWPYFALDGTRFAFLRETSAEGSDLVMIANADGSGVRALTEEPLVGVSGADWSSDGRFLLVDYGAEGSEAIGILDVEHGGIQPLAIGLPASGAMFRPPDGQEIVFTVGEFSEGAIFVVDRDGGAPRRIAWGGGPRYSPDGSRIVYGRSYQPEVERNETRVMNADGSNDRLVGDRPDIQYQGTAMWSPDGQNLIAFRNSRTAGLVLALFPADGSSPGREFEVNFNSGFGGLGWSPDGRQIAVMPASEVTSATLISLSDGSTSRVPRWYTASWQRLAPDR